MDGLAVVAALVYGSSSLSTIARTSSTPGIGVVLASGLPTGSGIVCCLLHREQCFPHNGLYADLFAEDGVGEAPSVLCRRHLPHRRAWRVATGVTLPEWACLVFLSEEPFCWYLRSIRPNLRTSIATSVPWAAS